MPANLKRTKIIKASDYVKQNMSDKPEVIPVGDNPSGKETVAAKPEMVCAVFDGTKEAVVMVHKIAKEMDVCLLEGKEKFDKVKRDPKIKVEIPKVKTYAINGVGDKGKDKTLEYIKACGEYCIKNGITKLYIPWPLERISGDATTQDMFMNGVPTTLAELSTIDKDGKEEKFVRSVFYWYPTDKADIEKNYKQYGILDQ